MSCDRELLEALGSGDRAAAAAFAARFGEPLLACLLRGVREELVAVDLWHETLAEARFRSRWPDASSGSVAEWLAGLAADVVTQSVARGQASCSARRRGGQPAPVVVSQEDLVRLRAVLEPRSVDDRTEALSAPFERLLARLPAPHELRRLRSSGLVVLTPAPTASEGVAR